MSEWIELKGGDCPVAADATVEYRLYSVARTCGPDFAGDLNWSPGLGASAIVAYRVVEETQAPEPTAPAVALNATGILQSAASIMEERGKQYDKPEGERSMGSAVAAFNIIAGRDLKESEGWLLLQILKDVRDRQRPAAHTDSLHDCVAYAALKAEARMAGK